MNKYSDLLHLLDTKIEMEPHRHRLANSHYERGFTDALKDIRDLVSTASNIEEENHSMDTVYECKQSSSEHWREAEPKLELALLLQSLTSPGIVTIDGWDWRIQPESERDLTLVGEIGAKILQTLQEVKVNPSSHHIVVPVVAEGWIRTLAEEIYDITQEQQ